MDILTNTGAHLLMYAEGDMDAIFGGLYRVYLLTMNDDFSKCESGFFYPSVEADGRIQIIHSTYFPENYPRA